MKSIVKKACILLVCFSVCLISCTHGSSGKDDSSSKVDIIVNILADERFDVSTPTSITIPKGQTKK